jgi:hypothetical protein
MSWSYSGSPGSSGKDQVRFYVQDTDITRQLLSDEEINFLLAQWVNAYGSPIYTAAVAAEVIASKFVGEVNVSADGVNVDQGSLFQRYNDLADSLRAQYKALYGVSAPVAEDIFPLDYDPTLVPLTFGIGFQDNARAGSQEYGSLRGPGKTWEIPFISPTEMW